MNFLLAAVSATQWVLLGLILVLIILYPVFMVFKNKKEKEKFDELSTGLKIGEKVLTSSGVYGEIVSIKDEKQGKIVVLKTGDDSHVGYITVDVLAIYNVFREEEMVAEENNQSLVEEKVEEKVQEVAVKEEKPAKAKKASKPSSKTDK